jgi:hypothetical protein
MMVTRIFLDTLVVQGAGQMMMINNIMMPVRAEHDRDHMLAKQLGPIPGLVLPPALALFLHLAHSDRHLGRAQREDRDRMQDRVAHIRHGSTPRSAIGG